MIKPEDLTVKDVGRWVSYNDGKRPAQVGRIKDFRVYMDPPDPFRICTRRYKATIFVVFHCNNEWENYRDYTGQSCGHRDLTFLREEEIDKFIMKVYAGEMI